VGLNSVLSDEFITKLGAVQCSLYSNFEDEYRIEHQILGKVVRASTETKGFFIEVFSFPLPIDSSPTDMAVEGSKGWIWRIKGKIPCGEYLRIDCRLYKPKKGTSGGGASGQFLKNGVRPPLTINWLSTTGTRNGQC